MAADWIKMRTDLQTHPKIVRILSATGTDKFRVIGGLHAVWAVFDTHSEDGKLKGYTPDLLDHVIGWQGFARAMESVGWLLFDGLETLTLPEFSAHNGQSAKRRAEDQKRKKESRHSVRVPSADGADKKRTRERDREEVEKKEKKSPPISLDAFIQQCADAGELPIPADDPIFDYAESIGLPHGHISLAWKWFKTNRAEAMQRGIRGWRQHFRKAVEGNWPKYWYALPEGGWGLTTAGQQAQRAQG